MPQMMGILRGLMKNNGKSFIFSTNGGGTPVSRSYIVAEFNRALGKIGQAAILGEKTENIEPFETGIET